MGAESVSVDTLRTVICSESVSVDTLRTVICNESVSVDTSRKRISSLAGHTSLSITLAAKSLTDRFSLQTRQAVVIDQLMSGQIKDFSFLFKADEISETDGDHSITGVYDINDLLLKPLSIATQYALAYPGDLRYYTAVHSMQTLTKALNRTLNINIDDFKCTVISAGSPTYKEAISKLCGWSSNLPQRQINVFLRGGAINVVQRGKESDIVTIVSYGEKYTISKKRIKTLKDETDSDGNQLSGVVASASDDNPDPATIYKNGTETVGDVTKTWINGLVTKEVRGTETTTWSYSALKPPAYVTSKTTESATQRIITEYHHFADGSAREEETVYEPGTNPDGSTGMLLSYTKTTRYNAIGQGNYSVRTDVDGVTVSDEISQGSPFQEASGYAINAYSASDTAKSTSIVVASLPARSLVDLSGWPVRDQDYINDIADAIIWLNKKIEERVALEVYDEIILDFMKRVIWQGNEYYLDSNTVTQEPEKFVQRVELVRWYA